MRRIRGIVFQPKFSSIDDWRKNFYFNRVRNVNSSAQSLRLVGVGMMPSRFQLTIGKCRRRAESIGTSIDSISIKSKRRARVLINHLNKTILTCNRQRRCALCSISHVSNRLPPGQIWPAMSFHVACET